VNFSFSAQPPPIDERLAQAQLENQKAQAEYYKKQSSRKSFWKKFKEDIPAVSATLGAVIAAAIAIISLGVNSATGFRLQEDAQFYEALKRFGDKDSEMIRSSAAGLLAQMAKRNKGYYDTAFNQLFLGVISEKNRLAHQAISVALEQLLFRYPSYMLSQLRWMNEFLLEELKRSLAPLFAAQGASNLTTVSEDAWKEAEALTGYMPETLRAGFEVRFSEPYFNAALLSAQRLLNSLTDHERGERLRKAREEVYTIAEQLRDNIEAIGSIRFPSVGWKKFLPHPQRLFIKFLPEVHLQIIEGLDLWTCVLHRAHGQFGYLRRLDFTAADLFMADLEDADLKFANFENAKLIRANLARSDLQGTVFDGTDLSGATLEDAQFHDTQIPPEALKATEWWKADFTKQPNLLEKLYEMYKDEMPILSTANHLDFHKSVRKHIGFEC